MAIAVFGLGEAGSAIAFDLAQAGVEVHGFDPGDVPTPVGVVRHHVPEEAVRDVTLVLAVTAASDARAALGQTLDEIGKGAIYADLSTATPSLKVDLDETASRFGLLFVDVALMATVPGRGLSTPCYASGPGAVDYAGIVNSLGGQVELVGDQAGEAATRKLLRSVVTKGLAAAVAEAMEAARHLELDDWLWDHIGSFVKDADQATVERLVSGTLPHADRRIVEMDSAAALLASVAVKPLIARATAELIRDVRDGKLGTGSDLPDRHPAE